MKIRSDIYKEVQVRLNAGERKPQIYNELKEKHSGAAVERSLAQWPYPEDKEQNRYFNYTLLIITGFFALLKLLQIIVLFQTVGASEALSYLPVIVIPLIIYPYVLYGIKNYNQIGYLLIILLGVQNLLRIVQAGSFTSNIIILLTLSVAAIVLGWIQKKRLFPNTSVLLRYKKDRDGNIIF
jgi:hypothetical protein